MAEPAAAVGTVLFFPHILAIHFLAPFPPGERDYIRTFVELCVSFPISLLWALCIQRIYRIWRKKRTSRDVVT
jgi:hypothetical protein